ncbi:CGGC domain-containing protein [Eubacterium aggregans]|jgi:hypothetical protein|uniref:CGGC domain-containing protein n=1 Tax=Eubacterium aggregans TaxID=81409 RepID=A0A1H4EHL7_9FIRM|nr:CGGC domain-containing protein [Eubacterium aggregans]
MKVGLIRCMQTEDMCPGTTDFKVMKEKKCAFEGIRRGNRSYWSEHLWRLSWEKGSNQSG